jgi:peptide/nickel transport system substrate-binding protein
MKRYFIVFLAVGLTLCLLMSACGGQGGQQSGQSEAGSGDSGPASATNPAEGSAAAPAVEAGTAGGEFVYSAGTEPTTFDPHFITDVNTARATVQVYETLIAWNENSELVPCLAESWTVSDDQLSWTFKLREGVTFHDGEPFNAEAVKYNLERLMSEETASPRASTVAMITEITATGEYEVTLKTETPYGPLLSQLSTYNMGMISPKAAEEFGKDYGLHPVGTGALKVDTWAPGQALEMSAYDGYWGEKSTVGKLTFRFVAEDASRVMMLKSGDADIAAGVPPIQVADLEADPNVDVALETGFRTIFLGMNNKKPPFDNIKVRQAVAYAINKQLIIDSILSGMATYPSGIESTVIAYSAQDLDPYTHDIEKAKALLAEAGYPDGFTSIIHTPEGRYPMDRQVAEVIQAMVAEIGIQAEIQVLDWGAYQEATNQGEVTEMFILGKGSPSGDPDYTLTLSFGTDAAMNNTFFSDPEVDRLLEEQRRSTDPAQRTQLLYEIQKRVNDACPQAVLYYEMQTFGFRSDVKGFKVWPNEMIDLRYLSR